MGKVSVEDALARLEVWTESCRLCQDEIETTGRAVGHDVGGHPEPRSLTHSFAGGMGADWDSVAAQEYIRTAAEIVESTGFAKATRHGISAKSPEGRWVSFSTRDDTR